jgi:hypothetical protein
MNTIVIDQLEWCIILATLMHLCSSSEVEGILSMSTSIEERVATLEKELTDLKQLIQSTRGEKD